MISFQRMSEKFDREQFFKASAIYGAGLAALLLLPDNPYVLKYSGPIKSLQGKEYLSEQSLIRMLNALEATSHPFLGKIVRGVKALHVAQNRPGEFPDWIDERSFPFAIVRDNTNDSFVSFTFAKESDEANGFMIVNYGTGKPQETVEKLFVGMKLGLAYNPDRANPLIAAFLLAKEYLTLLHGISANEEFYDITKKMFPDIQIVDPLGNQISDRVKQKAIGRRLLSNNLENESGAVYKILDGFPILLLGPVLKDLVIAGKIKDYGGLRSFTLAANLVTNSPAEFQRDLTNFMSSWRVRGGFTFPPGTALKVATEPYLGVLIDLGDQINKG